MLVDANILVYAHDEASPQHARAHGWLESALNGTERVGIPWPSVLAFLRLMTNPRVAASPLTIREAWAHVTSWFASPGAWVPHPTSRHAEVLGRLLVDLDLSSRLVTDAHLAALALEHGLVVCSADSDFARFPGVRWHNPVAVPGRTGERP